jgi:transcriptional regulator with XRE-family HTH domain
MENDMNTNAQLIRKLREDRAWSQEHLAAVAGLSARTIQRVEAEGSASRETRMAIAAALGVELARLNRVAEDEAPAAPAAAIPAPGKGTTPTERVVWGFIAIFLVIVGFGYTVGKDAAIRDSKSSPCVATPAQCAGR